MNVSCNNILLGEWSGVMNLTKILYHRQYKILLSSDAPSLDLDHLNTMGIWSHPVERHYLLTLQSNEDPNVDPVTFEKLFRKKTGLTSNEAKIEPEFGPLTLQNAVDRSWI